jgi:hypothetical protein
MFFVFVLPALSVDVVVDNRNSFLVKTLNKTSFPVSYSLYPPAALSKQDMVSSLAFIYMENIVHHYMYTSMEKKEEMCSLIHTLTARFSYFIFSL